MEFACMQMSSSENCPRGGGLRAKRMALLMLGCLAAVALWQAVCAQLPQQGGASLPVASGHARVIELRIGDEVEPVMAEYIDGGIDQAAQESMPTWS